MVRIRQAEALQHFLGARRHALVLGVGLLGRGDADQLDLGELVLADHAARVLAGRARLGAEARREGGEAQRQLLLVEHRVVHQVGERHLGGRDQPEAVVGVEHVLGELRQLADAVDRVVAHQERRIDLGVAALLDVCRSSMNCASARSSRASCAFRNDEARAGDLRGGGEIHLAGRLAQRHMVLGREGEVALAADAADLDVAGLVGAVGHVVERQVGQHLEAVASAPRRARPPRPRRPSALCSSAATSAISASAGSPLRLAMPICWLSALRLAWMPRSRRWRRGGACRSPAARADSGARLRFFRPASKAAGFSRMNRMSCMASCRTASSAFSASSAFCSASSAALSSACALPLDHAADQDADLVEERSAGWRARSG